MLSEKELCRKLESRGINPVKVKMSEYDEILLIEENTLEGFINFCNINKEKVAFYSYFDVREEECLEFDKLLNSIVVNVENKLYYRSHYRKLVDKDTKSSIMSYINKEYSKIEEYIEKDTKSSIMSYINKEYSKIEEYIEGYNQHLISKYSVYYIFGVYNGLRVGVIISDTEEDSRYRYVTPDIFIEKLSDAIVDVL